MRATIFYRTCKDLCCVYQKDRKHGDLYDICMHYNTMVAPGLKPLIDRTRKRLADMDIWRSIFVAI